MSHGAGAEMRRTLGTAVFSGMLGVTLFGIVLTPVFFFTIDWLGGSRLFASRFMRRAGAVALDVLTLGARRLRRALATRVGRKAAKAAPVRVSPGHEQGNGAPKDQGQEARPRIGAGS